MSTTVRLTIPPSVHDLWVITKRRNRFGATVHGRARAPAYESWLLDALPILHGIPALELPASVEIEIVGGKGWRANRDLDNAEKAIIDAMVIAGCLPDDSTRYLRRLLVTFTEPGKGRARGQAHVLLTC